MQYHHHGYVAHDPLIKDPAGTGIDGTEELPDTMDVLIVGAGPAGIGQVPARGVTVRDPVRG